MTDQPAPRTIVIKDARHAHTSAQRLRLAADLVDDGNELSPEVREHIKTRLRQIAGDIDAAVAS